MQKIQNGFPKSAKGKRGEKISRTVSGQRWTYCMNLKYQVSWCGNACPWTLDLMLYFPKVASLFFPSFMSSNAANEQHCIGKRKNSPYSINGCEDLSVRSGLVK